MRKIPWAVPRASPKDVATSVTPSRPDLLASNLKTAAARSIDWTGPGTCYAHIPAGRKTFDNVDSLPFSDAQLGVTLRTVRYRER